MANITLENYRGFNIDFNTGKECFECILEDKELKEAKSFKGIKGNIDDYIKENKCFKPFKVRGNVLGYSFVSPDCITIIGTRKDGRFISLNKNGEKAQISTYNETDYILDLPQNAEGLKALSDLDETEAKQRIENKKRRDEILSTLTIVTLKDYRNNLKK